MRIGWLLGLLVASGVTYHLAQKSAGADTPWPMLAIAYGAAFVVSIVLAVRAGGWPSGRATVNGLLIGASAIGIEAGFFFVYRAGWPLASASTIAGACATSVLAIVGVFVFHEPLGATRVAGLALALGGVALIARG